MFTDGDVRRWLQTAENPDLHLPIAQIATLQPHSTIPASAKLAEAEQRFKEAKVDQLVVVEEGQVLGLLDVQDLMA